MIRVEIKSPDVAEHRGTDKQGRPYLIRKQHGYLDVGKAYPVEVSIRLQDGQAAFVPGWYELTAECFYVARYGEVGVELSKIKPQRSAAGRAA